jgi:hypothetical protein
VREKARKRVQLFTHRAPATLAIAAALAAIAVSLLTNSFENRRLGLMVRNVKKELQASVTSKARW